MKKGRDKDKKKIVLLIATGVVAGLINGLFGAGSGLVLIPVISAFVGHKEKVAHATTLSCVMMMCLVGAGVYIANSQVKFDVLVWCLIGSLIGSIIGTVLLQKFKNQIINLIFSCILIVAGILMIVL